MAVAARRQAERHYDVHDVNDDLISCMRLYRSTPDASVSPARTVRKALYERA
jgi:hypothetical protein